MGTRKNKCLSPPPGFGGKLKFNQVWKLKVFVWTKAVSKSVVPTLYNYYDHTMFNKHMTKNKIVVLIVHVDDIIMTRNDC